MFFVVSLAFAYPSLTFFDTSNELMLALAEQTHQEPRRMSMDEELERFIGLCDRGEELACQVRRWATPDEKRTYKKTPPDLPHGYNMGSPATELCLRGDPASCWVEALVLMQSPMGVYDIEVETYQKGLLKMEELCSLKVGRACTEMSKIRANGWGRKKSAEKAQVFAIKACEYGSAVGCRLQALGGDEEDREQLLKKAVKLGDYTAKQLLEGVSYELCQAGMLKSCEATFSNLKAPQEQRLFAVELLCFEDPDQCSKMVAYRLEINDHGSDSLLTKRPAYHAWMHDKGYVIEWRDGSRPSHMVLTKEDVQDVLMRVIREQGDTAGQFVELKVHSNWLRAPFRTCPEKADAILMAGNLGIDPWALSNEGKPEFSECLDVFPHVPYFGARIRLDPGQKVWDGAVEIGQIKAGLRKNSSPLIACRLDADFELDPLFIKAKANRDGTFRGVKIVRSSGDKGMDSCVTNWLRTVKSDPITIDMPIEAYIQVF